MQVVTTFFALDSLRNLLSGLFAASTLPNDLLVQAAVLLASAAFWAYHARLARNDAAVEGNRRRRNIAPLVSLWFGGSRAVSPDQWYPLPGCATGIACHRR